MAEFFTATLTFPTVFLTFPLLVVIAYWLLVIAGGAELDLLEADTDTEITDLAGRWGLGGVPATVVVSVFISFAWMLCLTGSVLAGTLRLPTLIGYFVECIVVLVAGTIALSATRAIVVPLRRAFAPAPRITRHDFIGRVCVIRTGRVGPDFGQAELTSDDGSSAIIQVRQHAGSDMPLTHGIRAVVYDYDQVTETFWVASMEGI